MIIFCLANSCCLKSTLITLYGANKFMTCLPRWPLPPMQSMFFMLQLNLLQLSNYDVFGSFDNHYIPGDNVLKKNEKIQKMMNNVTVQNFPNHYNNKTEAMLQQNQFINDQQRIANYFNQLSDRNKTKKMKQSAEVNTQNVVARVMDNIIIGEYQIGQTVGKVGDKNQKIDITYDMQRMIQNKRKIQEKVKKNSLLYCNHKSQQIQQAQSAQFHILTHDQHRQFVREIVQKKHRMSSQIKRLKQKEERSKSSSLQKQKKLMEEERMMQIEKKKRAIKQNLQRMRENHQKFIEQEKESKRVFMQMRQKKRLYEHLKESYEKNIVGPGLEEKKKKLKEIKEMNKLDIGQIQQHQKEYLVWKHHSSEEKTEIVQSRYVPPPRTEKLNKLLKQQEKNSNKQELKKQIIREKVERLTNFTTLLKQKYRPKNNRVNTTIGSQKTMPVRDQSEIDKQLLTQRTQLGNKYLQHAKKLRKRAKTQQRYRPPEQAIQVIVQQSKQQSKVNSIRYLDPKNREQYLSKKKQQQIYKILNCNDFSKEEKVKRIRLADEKLSIELRKKQQKIKRIYNKQTSQEIFNLLLTTIKAKIHLIDIYNHSQI